MKDIGLMLEQTMQENQCNSFHAFLMLKGDGNVSKSNHQSLFIQTNGTITERHQVGAGNRRR